MNKQNLIGKSPNSKLLRDYKSSLISLSKLQFDTAIGLILGDASINSQNQGKNYRLKFEWGDKNKNYLDHVYSLFDEWVISQPHKKIRTSPLGNTVITWGFQTISHKAFNPLATLFLNENNKKSIKINLIRDHLNERGLAYWFMDDGGKLDYNKESKNKSVVFNTHSFTESEVLMMVNELQNKFNLNCDIRNNKGKKIIVINSTSYLNFRSLIDPYLISPMENKLP